VALASCAPWSFKNLFTSLLSGICDCTFAFSLSPTFLFPLTISVVFFFYLLSWPFTSSDVALSVSDVSETGLASSPKVTLS